MKKISFTFGLLLFCFIAKSQTPYYYYYNNEKQYLNLDTEHAFLSVKNQQMPDSIAQRTVRATVLRSDNVEKIQNQAKNTTNRFYAELQLGENLSEQQYLNLLAEMKQQNKDAIILPYFKFSDGSSVGLSNFFYVKLNKN